MSCAVARVSEVCGLWSVWTGAAAAADPVTTGTETAGIEMVDLGTIAPNSNSDLADAGALTVEFPSSFDDSINTIGAKIWLSNKPPQTGHVFAAEFASGAILPAVTTDADLAGATAAVLGNSPYYPAATHLKTTNAEYSTVNNRIATILLQAQPATGAEAWDVHDNIYTCPRLCLETPRTDFAAEDRILDERYIDADIETGHLMAYPNMELFYIQNYGSSAEVWHKMDSVREDSIEIELNKEFVEYKKGKPQYTVHMAVSAVTGMIRFSSAQNLPKLVATALQTTASRISSDRVIRVSHNADTCISGVIESGWAVRFSTIGGFKCTYRVGRGVLKPAGAYTGGTDSFSEQPYEITALGRGSQRELSVIDMSDTPILTTCLPIAYAVS
jgi:hypothetical protein